MFRKYILLALLPIMAACDKNDNIPVITLPRTYHKVPNLLADTMISTTLVNSTYIYDTLYTAIDSANCYIYYKSNVYKLKAYEEEGKHFSDSTGSYLCDVFDVNDVLLSTAAPVKVTSSRAWNTIYKIIDKKRQAIEITNLAPFPQDATAYLGRE